jgi:ketosteroid isomerase-like protein
MSASASFLERLTAATNAHDVDGIAACFTEDFVNETPCHPTRGFTGREQVRRNWSTIFGGVPDLTANVVEWVVDGDRLWSEWEMRGTRRDGGAHLMRGVLVFSLRGELANSIRFFLEPVEETGLSADEAVSALTGGPS